MKYLNKNIMLVEDNAIIALNQKIQLKKLGYGIKHIINGEQAINCIKLNSNNIDLILMDIDLGKGIDGTETAKEILKVKELPIVFLSSHTEPDIVKKTEIITSYGYVVKNSSITVLDASIKMAFKLFNAHKNILKHKSDSDLANKKLHKTVRQLEKANETLNRLNSAVKNTKEVIFITDKKGIMTYINPQFTKTYGYTEEEVVGKVNPRILHAEYVTDEMNDEFWKKILIEPHINIQFRNKTKDGRIIDTETSIDPIYDANGEIKEFVQIQRDITNQFHIEKNISDVNKQLLSNENTILKLQSILDSYRESIWSVDKEFKYTFLNTYFRKEYKEAYGRELELGSFVFSELRPERLKLWKDKYTSAMKGAKTSFEFIEDGLRGKKYFQVSLNPIHERNEITGVSAISVDITNQKVAEIKAQREMVKSQQYLDIAGVMFVAINKDCKITLVNKKLCEITGYKEEELLGKNWFKMMIPEGLQKEIIPVSEKLLSGEIEPVEYYENPIITKSGREIIVAWHNTILKDHNGKITGHLSSGSDITKRIKYEKEIKNLLEEKELILREVHHRIKNNMTTLIALVNLQANTFKGKETENAMGEIENKIRSMMVLYETLYQSSDFQHASTKKYLSSLIDDIIGNFSNSSKISLNKKILDIQIDPKIIFNFGIIVNEIVTNTMKYAFNDRSSGEIYFSLNYKNPNIIITIADNGIGLPSKIDLNNNPGFGMKLIKMLVEQMEGDVKIERNNGTKFIITCKLKQK